MAEKDSSCRIVFFGTPDFAVASLRALVENNFNVVAVVTAPDKPAGRGMQLRSSAVKVYAEEKDIPVLQPEKLRNASFIEELKSLRPDLQVVVAFRMLPEQVWNMPPMGTINVHGSLLPDYRGAAPINWAIINGEKKTGVTTFKLKHEIDTGDILLQKETDILPDDDFGTVYERLMNMGAELLVDTISRLETGTLKPHPQRVPGEPKHAPKIYKEDGLIDWRRPAEHIFNQIRGLAPYPAAYTYFNGKQLKVFKSDFQVEAHQSEPGTYDSDGKTYLRFAAADGWVLCKEVQLEGKRKMMVADFIRGMRGVGQK